MDIVTGELLFNYFANIVLTYWCEYILPWSGKGKGKVMRWGGGSVILASLEKHFKLVCENLP